MTSSLASEKMLFKGHSTRLEMLIEKIQSNKETNFHETDVSGQGTSSGLEETIIQNSSDSVQDVSAFSLSLTLGSPKSEPYSDSDESSSEGNQDGGTNGVPSRFNDDDGVDIKMEPPDSNESPFTCKYCPRLFKHKRSRDRHIKLHTGDKKYKCLQCDSAFARSDHLKIHLKTHDVKKQYKCTSCNKGYNTSSALSFHEQSHTKDKEGGSNCSTPNSNPERSLICFHCSETFTTSDSLQNHLFSLEKSENLEVLKDVKTFCIYCFQEFPNVTLMYEHIQICHKTVKTEMTGSNTSVFKNTTSFQQEIHQDFNISMTVQNISFEKSILANNVETNNPAKRQKDEVRIDTTVFKRKCYEQQQSNNKTDVEETFICACCYKQLPNFKSFLLHMETHVAAAKTEVTGCCVVCNQQLNLDNLSKHMFQHSITQLQNFVCCCPCNQYFKDYDELKKHFSEEHIQNVYRCSICKEMFEDKATMNAHFNNKHASECDHFECNFCSGPNRIFQNKNSAEQHLTKFHLDQLCFKPLTNQVEFVKPNGHNNLEKKENDFKLDFLKEENSVYKTGALSLQCAYCKEFCKTKTELQIHLKGHQILEKSKHKCNICDEVYLTANKLANHKLIHCKIVEGNICVQCKSALKDTDAFYAHQVKHNNTSKSNLKFLFPSICVVCSQTLQSDMEIELHAKFHLKFLNRPETESNLLVNKTPENTYVQENNSSYQSCLNTNPVVKYDESLELQCYLCKKHFESKEKLQIHLIEHNFFGMNQFSCYVCSSVFTAASGLQGHLVKHNLTEKPYQCTKCQISFLFRAELDNHSFLHNFQTNFNVSNESDSQQNCFQGSSSTSNLLSRVLSI